MWVRDYKPEMKSQSRVWMRKGETQPIKFWRAQAKLKQMMIFAYDHKGIITSLRMPQKKNIVGPAYTNLICHTLRSKVCKLRPEKIAGGVSILHDNALPHGVTSVTATFNDYRWETIPHRPYSPNMSPPDYDLFPKLKMPLPGKRFSSPEELLAAVTREIRTL